ncbi:MAG: cache domain-containing protein [Candidatus Bathyarchaeia archaeon]
MAKTNKKMIAIALVVIVVIAAAATGIYMTLQCQTQKQMLQAFVEGAYQYAQEHGQEAALREFNNKTGPFVEGQLYIFAYDTKGNTLALPFQPQLLGTNRWNATDSNGTPFIQEIVKTAQSGGGFVHYFYPDPSDNFTIKPKVSYVMMAGQDWLIGAGVYEAQDCALF